MSKQYPIQSDPIPFNDGKPRAGDVPAPIIRDNQRPTRIRFDPVGFVLIVIGVLWWLPAARTTVDGWVVLLNTMLDFFGIIEVIPYATGWLLLGLAIVVGGIYSGVEAKNLPITYRNSVIIFAPFMFWVGWLFLSTTDVASTFIGIMTPPRDAWAIHRQLAQNPPAAGVLALLSTFTPDWFIIFGIKMLFK